MIFNGNKSKDERGSVSFVNDFDFKDVKRFYLVKNKKLNFCRGWHGHKLEGKYVFVVRGKARIGWELLEPKNGAEYGGRTVLSADNPQILYIAPGYANAAVNLTKDTEIMYFSTSTLEDSKNDDFRFPAEKWKI